MRAIVLSASRRSQPFRLLLIGAILLLVTLATSACGSGNEEDLSQPDLLRSLPEEWTVIEVAEPARFQLFKSPSPWQAINIDGDLDTEYLVLYTYDNSTSGAADGPKGGLIYDLQDTSESITGQPPRPSPLQPSTEYERYRLLPSYWRGMQGAFLALPGNPESVSTAVTKHLVHRTGNAAQQSSSASADQVDELVLIGNRSVLTFIWWRNQFDGYGVTQLFGPDGFRNINGEGESSVLSAWAEQPVEIEKIDALYPIYGNLDPIGPPAIDFADIGRSVLCRTIRYLREPVAYQSTTVTGPAYQSDIQYVSRDMGIQFCDHTPVHPFYPEGVVVKYLRASDSGDRNALLWPFLDQVEKDIIIERTPFNPDQDRVEHVETRTSIDYPQSYRTNQPPALVNTRQLTTQVCAEVLSISGDDSGRKLFYFSLIHSAPSVDTATPPTGDAPRASDQLWISYVDDATEWGAADCVELIALNAE